ncbi:MAG: hypothetical protein ABL999_17485 [Pyrinomonadaceae bacterium]
MAHFECNTGLGPPFPFKFPDEGFPVVFRGKYFAAGAVSDEGVFSCEIEDPEIVRLFDEGKADWYFDSIDGHLSAQILES